MELANITADNLENHEPMALAQAVAASIAKVHTAVEQANKVADNDNDDHDHDNDNNIVLPEKPTQAQDNPDGDTCNVQSNSLSGVIREKEFYHDVNDTFDCHLVCLLLLFFFFFFFLV